mgnify:CR=1 FL=1
MKSNISLQSFISPYTIERPVDWAGHFPAAQPLDVEIGFGNGDFLARTAQNQPTRNFVGIEQKWERIYKTLKKINRSEVNNVRVLLIDAWVAFERLFLPQSIEHIYCLFPCPWPKKEHLKHRLFSQAFLQLTNSRLKPNGQMTIVTDHQPYYEWISQQLPETGFSAEGKTIAAHYGTKYERKWVEQGQRHFFELHLIKKGHWEIPAKEDVTLQPYFIDTFAMDRPIFENVIGPTTIIFKEWITDAGQRKAMIHLVVAEEKLTQHLWVAIFPVDKQWCIAPALGQNFIPSSGIAEALKVVYQLCQRSCGSEE